MKLLLLLLTLCTAGLLTYSQSAEERLQKNYSDLQGNKDTTYVHALMAIGRHHGNSGNFDSSEYYFKTAIAASQKINYKLGECSGTSNLGYMYSKWADYDSVRKTSLEKQGMELLHSALEMTANLEPLKRESTKAEINRRIASIYLSLGDKKNALGYLKNAESYLAKSTDTLGLLNLYGDFIFCSGSEDTLTGFRYLRSGLALCDVLEKNHKGDENWQTSVNVQRIRLINNSLVDDSAASINKPALLTLEKVWKDSVHINTEYNKCMLIGNLGSLYWLSGQYQKAIDFTNMSLERCPEVYVFKTSSYLNLAKSYAGIGNYKAAYEHYQLYNDQYEGWYEEDRHNALAELEAKYENEKKEQQIASLNKEKKSQRLILTISIVALVIATGLLLFVLRANRLQRRLFAKEKELQKKEMEKRMFELEQTALRAQMNPHFIFNSLNSVQRFVINNDVEGVNQYLSTFANLIRQTLENSGKQLIPLSHEVKYLETYLRLEQMRSNDKFNYRINITSDVDPEETYIPNMIIQPYLENSVIHGMAGKKPNEGVINLTISKNHKLTCIVEDNGIGITTSKAKQIDTGHESMGTAITEKRIEMFNTMNNEKIELEVLDKSGLSQQENGTKVMIKFPLTSSAN